MARYCIVGEVKPEYLEKYKKLHREIHKGQYRELLSVIRASGVKDEVVFMRGTMVVIFYEADDLDRSYKLQGSAPVTKRWNEMMAPMFASSYDFNVSERLPVLEKVFDLNEQIEGQLNP